MSTVSKKNTLETRAAKSASHRAPPGTAAWCLYYSLALLKLEAEAYVARMVADDEMREDLFAPLPLLPRDLRGRFFFPMLPSQDRAGCVFP